jgi:hypothetical protein
MAENFDQNIIEAEIAQLSKEIEDKRRQLESQRGITGESTGDKELVRAVMAEKIFPAQPSSAPAATQTTAAQAIVPPPPPPKPAAGVSYLDSLDANAVETVNMLINKAFSGGLTKAISKAQEETPYILDAFHDALTDKLYEELKSRKLVK